MANYAKLDNNKNVIGWFPIKEKIGESDEGEILFSPGNEYPNEDKTKLVIVPDSVWEERLTKNFKYENNSFVEYEPTYEFTANEILIRRNKLLANSDWTQMSDVSIPNDVRMKWAEYRQALRDISDQPGFPNNVIWPEKP